MSHASEGEINTERIFSLPSPVCPPVITCSNGVGMVSLLLPSLKTSRRAKKGEDFVNVADAMIIRQEIASEVDL